MTDRSGVFAGDNPFELAQSWLDEATVLEPNDPNAIALSTVDSNDLPNVRIVLLKEITADGFIFYTNQNSTKGSELKANAKAAFVMHWKSLRRQIRVRGSVRQVGDAQAEAYFSSRSLKSRLGAWASNQSRPIKNRAELMNALEKYTSKFGNAPQKPPHWGGFLITPCEIEFWCDGDARLHDRFRWTRQDVKSLWNIDRLAP